MCGINGIIDKNIGSNLSNKISLMNSLIAHRGPDDEGDFVETNSLFSIAMGMRRLSIIDLKTGKQPIYSKDQSKIIVFNGEIYNYRELRDGLLKEGCVFSTDTDTEVILKLYEKEGAAAFAKLDGMYAFSIYDRTTNKTIIARDFFGEKPLYYTQSNNIFTWSSELKSIVALLPEKPLINPVGFSLYFQLTYIPAPYTIYEGIHKLEPNHYIEINCSDITYSIKEIHRPLIKGTDISKSEAIKITYDLVQESVLSRSVSDVPLGTFLSGGVDSSIISLCLAKQSSTKIDTFSIGFENKKFDESKKARLVSKIINSNHHEFIISEKDLTGDINEVILNFDEPFADSSALATFLLSKKTKEFVKVALTGDGGDEVFGGYNKYYMGLLNKKYISVVPKSIHRALNNFVASFLNIKQDTRGLKFKTNKFLNAINYETDFYYNIISLGFQQRELKEMINPEFYSSNSLQYYKTILNSKNTSLFDFKAIDKIISLEGDMLVKVDRTSMLASLECRAPFLNKELWDFSNQLPEHFLINGWDKKHILKKAFEDYFPSGFLNKSKKGFSVPVGDWLRSELRKELLSYCDRAFIETQNIFAYDITSTMIKNHLEGRMDNTFRVWTFYCFQKWYRSVYYL